MNAILDSVGSAADPWIRIGAADFRSFMVPRSTRPLLAAALTLTLGAHARTFSVSDSAGLTLALGRAPAGAIIKLAPGLYSHVIVLGFHGSATVTSANPARPAILSDLMIRNSSGLVFRRLEFSTETHPIGSFGARTTIPFQVLTSKNITLTELNVHGAAHGTLATDESGVMVRDSDHIEVSESDFHNLNNAIQHQDDTYLTVRHNHFHLLRDDGLRGGGSSNVLVAGNHCDSNHPDGAADPDHPDCIQFWTSGTKVAAHDITITGNTYERGSGNPTQGVHMRDELATLHFRHVTITNNVIKGAMYNGIEVFGAEDVTISGNIVCPYADQPSWIVVRVVDGAKLSDNSASRYAYIQSQHIAESHNKIDGICPEPR